MPGMDVNVWSGQFPFRRVAGTTLSEIHRRLGGLGFTGAVVSPLEAIFQEDSYGAEEALSGEISATAGPLETVWHFKVVNPTCNWWERDLRRAVDELGVAGIRLCPTYHNYRLDDTGVPEALSVAADLGVPVQVMCKMQDHRMHWMLHTDEVETDQAGPFLERFSDRRVILSGLHVSDMLNLADTVNACPSALMDTSRLKGPWRTFGKLTEKVAPERLCFGSLWPINIPECPLAQLHREGQPSELRDAVLWQNAARLLGA